MDMKYFTLAFVIGFLGLALFANAQEGMTAEEWKKAIENRDFEKNEIWKPIPEKVTPGYTNSQAPSDAIILFSGTDLSSFQHSDSSEAKWTVGEGSVAVKPGTGDIYSKQGFGDIQLHIEWKSPVDTTGLEGQARGNSGVFLMGKYEVQILDNYKNSTYSNGQAGSIYKQYIPAVNACKPPGEWQSYDIIFTAPRFKEDGSLESPAYLTVSHNGVLIQYHKAVRGGTYYIAPPAYNTHAEKLPLRLQDHGNFVSFRNIWVREL
ncbi:MAG: hypothetical protein ACJAUH_001464 [Saprospiraceae bacterium]|jgi:hypothetical protein